VLFIDAIDSTPFAERADPETVRAHQSDFFGTVRRIVRQYGGVVEKYIGDAVLVLFGAPVATETDAARCVRAGLDLQRALARETADEDSWAFRVGIATGEALVDVTAAHDGGQAILAGDVVNTAARLQAAAPAGGVLICATTHQATRTEIRSVSQSPLTLRGRSTPTEVWLALAPVQQQVDEETDAIPMVGRDHELALLTSALHHVIDERSPRVVTVLGRAGIGKSRLVRELYQHAVSRVDTQVCWRSGRCQPFGENVAYAALADIVKAQAGVLATDTGEAARDRLDAALADLVPVGQSARFSDALRPLLGLPGSPLSTEDAESAWRRFLLALAGRGPTVLVFEDLHWADHRMIRFVELIGATVRDVPLLVVCTARPELLDREPTWATSVPGMLSVSLTPLRDDSIATLYERMFAQATFPPDLLRPLVELADGIPLYAHEYGRMLVERGTLRQDEDTWAMEPSAELPMPQSVHAVIANRIDLLDAGERSVLQAAAVVGPRFWPGAVAAALGTSADTVERALRTLTQRDLVREQLDSSMAEEPEYRFRHALVSDVCYERLPLAERIARHTRTADWLDARVDSRGTELADVVAHHRFTAHEAARALGLDTRPYAAPALAALLHAGRRAAMLNAYDVAAVHVARADQLVGSVGPDESPTPPEGTWLAGAVPSTASGPLSEVSARLGVELLATELALHQDEAGFLAGTGPDRLAELAALLYRARDHGGAARAWTLLGQIAWLRGDRPGALRCLDRSVELFDSWPDTPEKAQTYAELGRLHMLNYEHVPALGATQIAAEIAERLGLVELRANALITIGMCRYQSGDPTGLTSLQESLAFCRAHQLPSERRAAQHVADALREEGQRFRSGSAPAPSEPAVTPAFTPAGPPVAHTRNGNNGARPAVAGSVVGADPGDDALAALFAGDWDHFFAIADAFLDSPTGEEDLRVRGARGWMRALRGDQAGAALDVAQALDTARSRGFWRLTWTALAHGALCETLLQRPDDAERMLIELAESWRRMRTIASGEWVAAAGHAAVRLGEDAAAALRDALGDAPHHTAWSRAALSSLDGTLAAARGDLTAAARCHLNAAERYSVVGSQTDRMLALGGAVRVLSSVDARSSAAQDEVAAFAGRNRIVSLL
jgi:class 3 adenylate cyclase/tetratricopeptide (TPR) repeat protein